MFTNPHEVHDLSLEFLVAARDLPEDPAFPPSAQQVPVDSFSEGSGLSRQGGALRTGRITMGTFVEK